MITRRISNHLAMLMVAGTLAAVPSQALTIHPAQTATTLTQPEADSLAFMREEEKMARDVYLAMHELWGSQVFANIAASEQRHMNAVKYLLDAYGLEDPASGEVGVFANPEIQALYGQLIAKGSQSALEAFKTGALIEEVDIADLTECLESAEQADIRRVYENLLAGSHNHLRAFVRNIEILGETYSAQEMPQAAVDEILAGSNQMGQGRGRGRGQGMGQGRGRGMGQGCALGRECDFSQTQGLGRGRRGSGARGGNGDLTNCDGECLLQTPLAGNGTGKRGRQNGRRGSGRR